MAAEVKIIWFHNGMTGEYGAYSGRQHTEQIYSTADAEQEIAKLLSEGWTIGTGGGGYGGGSGVAYAGYVLLHREQS